MTTTAASFMLEARDLLADAGAVQLFKKETLERWRDAELRGLYKYNIAKEVTNYSGTYTDMLASGTTQTDFAIPSGWLRITKIEFWTNETSPRFVANSTSWDDRVRAGFVTIYDAPLYYDSRIKLIGLTTWTGIDDATMPQEVVDVVLYGTVLRAITSVVNKRAASQRAAGSARSAYYALVGLVSLRRSLTQDYRDAIRRAHSVLRPIG